MILRAKLISPGLAEGTARVLGGETSIATARGRPRSGAAAEELERLQAALARAVVQVEHVRRTLAPRLQAHDAAIFDAQALMLADPGFRADMERGIREQDRSAEAAVADAVLALRDRFLASPVPEVRDKAADITDIGCRVLRCLGVPVMTESAAGVVVVAEGIAPSELVELVHRGAVAAITKSCGQKSHTAILARGLGTPLVTDIRDLDRITDGSTVVIDAEAGLVIVDPTPEEAGLAADVRRRLAAAGASAAAPPEETPRTADGQDVTLLLNISDPLEAGAVAGLGAAGIGLYRTEFLYFDRVTWPSEQESHDTYSAVAEAIGDRELNIRLADFGAEKSPSYADVPINRNPSLGIRGARLLLQRRDILRPQVLALARLGRRRPLTVLLPMIDTADTLLAITDVMCRLCGCRDRSGLPFRIGMMVEVPGAALMIRDLLDHVDAVSVGLNDLTQYLLAADRDDELVEKYHDPLQPAVLRTVHGVLREAASRGLPVTMCGELAGDPMLETVLLALGARRFSISRSHYRAALSRIARLDLGKLGPLADEVLGLASGAAVHRLVSERTAAATDQARDRGMGTA